MTRTAKAVRLRRLAVVGDPTTAEFYANLTDARRTAGQVDESIDAYMISAHLDATNASVSANLRTILLQTGQFVEAAGALRHAAETDPRSAEHVNSYGRVVTHADPHDALDAAKKAIESAEKARAIRPTWAAVSTIIGNSNLLLGRHADAEAEFREAIKHDSHFVPAIAGLGNVYGERGDQRAAQRYLRRDIETNLRDAAAHSTLLRSMVADSDSASDAIFEQHRVFGRLFDSTPEPFTNDTVPDRRIRVGYLSPDLRRTRWLSSWPASSRITTTRQSK